MMAFTNFVSYLAAPTSRPRIGHLDLVSSTITPLSYPSGAPLSTLYEVISSGDPSSFVPSSQFQDPVPLSSVTLLPPISGRDVLAVGKNYVEHAKEFNSSGYDSSDKVDQPTHPVIFTKRATSIIASGEDIYTHQDWTETLDYEGEIAVILGKEGRRIKEADAWDYVWGFTIINDVTAREKQRDHKQFFLGKSGDTFCPMGPIAVPKEALPEHQKLRVITRINGEVRQESDLSQLIFSIPNLITTISAGQTIQHGDVIATGTPAGVGFGQKPPVFLNHGDVVEVEVTGLGVLRNKISSDSPPAVRRLDMLTHSVRSPRGNLKELPSGKLVHVEEQGDSHSSDVIVFVHGLGGSTNYYRPVLSAVSCSGLSSKRLVLYDLEGHGLSPTKPTSSVSIASYAADLKELISTQGVSSDSISIVGHSMGCYVVLEYATQNQVKNIVLIGPPPIPLSPQGVESFLKRADTVRANGMAHVAKTVAATATSQTSRVANPLAVGYVHTLLLANDPEGYARGCTALVGMAARPINIDRLKISGKKVLLAGDEDPVAPVAKVKDLSRKIGGELQVLNGVGHWHALEDVAGVAKMLADIL